ncbi:MAG: sensor domain-containing diguanylate cyclase [Hahellaceae bacterium]|nr:sensor domain-containing diguanylate cyclase [Hahellaceae bacterium]
MTTIEELIETARKNEEIARRLFDIEVQVLNLSHCKDFVEQLLEKVQSGFNIDYVWLTLTDSPGNDFIRQALASIEADRVRIIPTLDFLQATQSAREPVLVNQGVGRFRILTPKPVFEQLGSIAVLPLMMNNSLIGSLNLGACDCERYSPEKDRYFLTQLAVKVSLSLASVSAREQINFLATRDPLTRLRNRREMEESLERELSRIRRHPCPLAVVFIDCDDFKPVNDTFGHDCGDAYLKHVACHLAEMIRLSDSAFRFAGDEFVLLLPNQNTEGASVIAQRIREQLLASPLNYHGVKVPVSISFGVACTEQLTEHSARALLKYADQKLYEMKRLKPVRSRDKPLVSAPSTS